MILRLRWCILTDCIWSQGIWHFKSIRCKHFRKVKPSSEEDPLAKRCTSWTWASQASKLSKMKYYKACTRAALFKNSPLFFRPRKREIEDYIALDLNFLNLLAGTKSLRTFVVDNTSEKSHSPPWSRKCCRSRERSNMSMWVNLLVFLTSEKNLQDHADPSGGKEPPQQVTILKSAH